ncbi:MAG: imidazolonepropionase [Bacillota bacterium]|nr:imidazolonepropionase [Bacillota bacterium]MDW7683554.1 imidazolonepropionase [Bacillota bacterium]
MKPTADLVIRDAAQLLTFAGPSGPRTGKAMADPAVIEDGAVAALDGRIVAVGKTDEVLQTLSFLPETKIVSARGKVVMPCFVDPHTHLIYGGSREEEFVLRLEGAQYLDILAAGGGILSTVKATRAATEEELTAKGHKILDNFLHAGVGTVESKSGYGLDTETELKQLRAAHALDRQHDADIVHTFLGAHAFPKEYDNNREDYVDLVIHEMLPRVAAENLAEFCDVFCEEKIFTIEQSRRILTAAKECGLKPKLHADEIVSYGGAELAAQVGAVSADHLLQASEKGIAAMAEAGVVAVLLPGTAFFLMKEYARARRFIEAGVPVALSTDCNPGSSPTQAMHLILSLACLEMKMKPAEALTAATINAACAIDRGHLVGSLEPGKQADILIMDAPNYNYIPYHYGISLVHTVFKKGKKVVGK